MPEGQMTQSDYLQIDACPARIDALEISKADRTELAAETAAREAADAAHDTLLADLIDGGAKNIMPLSNPLTTETKRGITATYDFDAGTITLNGEHDGTGDAQFYLYTGNAADQKVIPAGSYHLSGCPAGGSTDTYCLIVQNVGGSPAYKLDTGSGQDFTISEDGRMAPIIRVKKPAGQTVSFDNVVFQPMICLQSAKAISDKFVPYCPTLAELYAMIQGGTASLASTNSLRQTAQLAVTPNDTGTEGETE